jgi:hypothetical protein
MTPKNENDRLVKVFEAPTITEALVVRGLLKSAGVYSPEFETAEPFALHDPPEGWHDSEVWVPESQAEDARRIIEEAAKARPTVSPE